MIQHRRSQDKDLNQSVEKEKLDEFEIGYLWGIMRTTLFLSENNEEEKEPVMGYQ